MTDHHEAQWHYVWGWPSVTINDAPDDRRLLFALRLTLFRIARTFAYTRRGLTFAWVITACLGLAGAAIALMVSGSLGWVFVGGALAPAFLLVVLRHRSIRVRAPSEGSPGAGVREPRRPVRPSGSGAASRRLP